MLWLVLRNSLGKKVQKTPEGLMGSERRADDQRRSVDDISETVTCLLTYLPG